MSVPVAHRLLAATLQTTRRKLQLRMIMPPIKAVLRTSTLIPALALLAGPCNATALRSGETILLAQQQEPAEKSDRPERRRPESVPGQPPAKQSQPPAQPAPPAKQAPPAAPQAPSAPPARQAEPPTHPAPPAKQVQPPAPPAKQVQPVA